MTYKSIFKEKKKTGSYQSIFGEKKQDKPVLSQTKQEVKSPTKFSPFTGTLEKTVPESQKVGYGELARIKNLKGGGQYYTDPAFYKTGEQKEYGTLPSKIGSERDHLIPASLGGTSYDPNIHYLESQKGLLDTLLKKPADIKNRQEGKVLVELDNIKKYKKGEISLNQARINVLNWKNQKLDYYKEMIKNLPSAIIETISGIASPVSILGQLNPENRKRYSAMTKQFKGEKLTEEEKILAKEGMEFQLFGLLGGEGAIGKSKKIPSKLVKREIEQLTKEADEILPNEFNLTPEEKQVIIDQTFAEELSFKPDFIDTEKEFGYQNYKSFINSNKLKRLEIEDSNALKETAKKYKINNPDDYFFSGADDVGNDELFTQFKNRYIDEQGGLDAMVTGQKPIKTIFKGIQSEENKIKKQIGYERFTKELDNNVLSRIKENNNIKEWSNANSSQLQAVLDDLKLLQKGDKMLTRGQVESLKEFGIKSSTTKREAVEILGDVAGWEDRNLRIFNFFKVIDQKIESVAGKDAEKIKNILTRPRAKAVTEMFKEEINLKTAMRDMLDNFKVKDKNSRALIMRFGEKRMTLEELKKATPKWQEIVEADKWFRNKYDDLLDTTNAELKRLGYAENKLILKRQDYYTHSQEMGSVWNLIENKGGDISPVLEQISEFTKPNRKFNPFTLRRRGGEFVEDAGKAFEAYLAPTLNNKYLTESIIRHRAVSDILAHKTLGTKNLNQFIGSLRYAADQLAGKSNPFDRPIMNFVVGRNAIQILNKMSQRFAANRIVGNIGSALMQISGIPNSVLKNNIIRTSKGLLTQAFSPLLRANDPLLKSEELLRRYGEKGLKHGESVFPTIITKGAKIFSIPFEVIEKNISKSIWRASFDNAWSQGFKGKELIDKSDEIFSSIVGSRVIGEKAMAFESGILSLPLQFQLEVNTSAQMWKSEVFDKIFKNPVQATRAAIEASITLYLMNTLFDKTMGRTPLPDPIRAVSEATQADSYLEGIGRIFGEALSSIAGGQFIASLFPDNLKKKYFGRSEIGIYPGGIPIATALTGGFKNPSKYVYDFVLPFGGGQLKKLLDGIEGLDKMGSYNSKSKLQFPINQNQWFQVIVFGKYSTKEAKEYFDKQRTTLSDKQTVEYFLRTQKGEEPQKVYNDIIKSRIKGEYEREIIKEVIKKIKDNPVEGLALLQLWKKQNIISNEMETDIIGGLK